MDIFTAIRERKSVREFRDADIENAKLLSILEAARLSPSAKNMQAWKFVVVRDAATRKKLAEAANGQIFAGTAPCDYCGVRHCPRIYNALRPACVCH